MSVKKNALGKGLGALISDLPLDLSDGDDGSVVEIRIKEIVVNPAQPRKQFSQESLEELAASIKKHGIIQPIVVLQKQEGYHQIVVGERRFRAAQIAGLSSIPAIIRKFEREQLLTLALLENIQREDLNALETASAYKEIVENLQLTQEELAQLVGKSRSSVANTLRLLKLPKNIQEGVLLGYLTEGHARALLSLDDPLQQESLREKIMEEGLSVREVEDLVQERNFSSKKKKVPTPSSYGEREEDRDIAASLSRALALKVKVQTDSSGKGKLELYFSTHKELKELQARLISLKNQNQ